MRKNCELRYLIKKTKILHSAMFIKDVYYFENQAALDLWLDNWNKSDHELEEIEEKGKCWYNDKGLLCPSTPTMLYSIAKERMRLL